LERTVRVLVVDDSVTSSAAICSQLEAHNEIEVVGTVKNGFELLERAQELQPDVVITDLHMPRLNGVECVLRLRELMPDTQFIVVTGSSENPEGISQSAGPADQYFDKSTSLENVLDEIRRFFPEVFGKRKGTDAETSTGDAGDPREASYC